MQKGGFVISKLFIFYLLIYFGGVWMTGNSDPLVSESERGLVILCSLTGLEWDLKVLKVVLLSAMLVHARYNQIMFQ